jgi:hypothetical protein
MKFLIIIKSNQQIKSNNIKVVLFYIIINHTKIWTMSRHDIPIIYPHCGVSLGLSRQKCRTTLAVHKPHHQARGNRFSNSSAAADSGVLLIKWLKCKMQFINYWSKGMEKKKTEYWKVQRSSCILNSSFKWSSSTDTNTAHVIIVNLFCASTAQAGL